MFKEKMIKTVTLLNIFAGCFLIGLATKSTSSPTNDEQSCLQRRQIVLQAMSGNGTCDLGWRLEVGVMKSVLKDKKL